MSFSRVPDPWMKLTCTRKNAHLVNKLCSQQACQQVCSNPVILSSCTKSVTDNLVDKFLTCIPITSCSNLLSWDNQCEHTLSTSFAADLLQFDCCRFVTSCAFLRVYIQDTVGFSTATPQRSPQAMFPHRLSWESLSSSLLLARNNPVRTIYKVRTWNSRSCSKERNRHRIRSLLE